MAGRRKFCEEKNIYLIEDAAHAHGSSYENKHSGEFGVAAAYSFFSTKTFTSGEGGMVVTNNQKLSEKCYSFRDYGKKSQWESVHTVFSGNFRMSNITAVIGNAHISEMTDFLKKKQVIADMYTENLSDGFEKILPAGQSGWYKYIVYLPKKVDKKEFKEKCKSKGFTTSWWRAICLSNKHQSIFSGKSSNGNNVRQITYGNSEKPTRIS